MAEQLTVRPLQAIAVRELRAVLVGIVGDAKPGAFEGGPRAEALNALAELRDSCASVCERLAARERAAKAEFAQLPHEEQRRRRLAEGQERADKARVDAERKRVRSHRPHKRSGLQELK